MKKFIKEKNNKKEFLRYIKNLSERKIEVEDFKFLSRELLKSIENKEEKEFIQAVGEYIYEFALENNSMREEIESLEEDISDIENQCQEFEEENNRGE